MRDVGGPGLDPQHRHRLGLRGQAQVPGSLEEKNYGWFMIKDLNSNIEKKAELEPK